jgi:hypothetical protein
MRPRATGRPTASARDQRTDTAPPAGEQPQPCPEVVPA